MKHRTIGSLFLIVLATGSRAQTVFFDNFTGYSWNGQWIIGGTGTSQHEFVAQQFTSQATGTVTDVTVSFFKEPLSPTGGGLVSILTDNADTVGTLIGSGAFADSTAFVFSGTNTNMVTVSGLNIGLTAGQKYWLQVSGDVTTYGRWCFEVGASSGGAGLSAWNMGAGYSYESVGLATMTVEGVPEPASVAAIMTGLIGIAARSRRRRVQDAPPASVA